MVKRLSNKLIVLGSDSDDSSSSDSSEPSINSIEELEENTEYISNILGEDPSVDNTFGPDISEKLATRWKTYISQGLPKESKAKLLESWPIPKNCPTLLGPKLNPEVQPLLSTSDIKKEVFLMDLQNSLGKGITALGSTLSKLLEINNPDNPDPNLSPLVDAGKMLCDVHHTISNHRKFVLYHHFNNKIQKMAALQHPDGMLFGEDFGEKCKAAKVLESSAKDLKPTTPSTSKNAYRPPRNYRWKFSGQQGRGSKAASNHKKMVTRKTHSPREPRGERWNKRR